MTLIEPMVSSKSNEWVTPQWLFDKLDEEFNFTLDPCSNNDNAKCKKFYTEKENGLKQNWDNDVVFMNPPYGGNTNKWIRKAWIESKKGATVVCLIVSSTDRSYWHKYIFPYASQIRFLRGRLKFSNTKFSNTKSTAPFASAIIVFGDISYNRNLIYYLDSVNKNQDLKKQYRLLPMEKW